MRINTRIGRAVFLFGAVLLLGAAAAIARPGPPDPQTEPVLSDQRQVKPPRALQRELRLRRFDCALGLIGPPGFTYDSVATLYVEAGAEVLTDAHYEKVTLSVAYLSWIGSGDSFSTYPGGGEVEEFTDVDRTSIIMAYWRKDMDSSLGGCHVDAGDPRRAHCRYRVTLEVSYLEEGHGPMIGRSATGGWKQGAQCARDITWQRLSRG